MKKIIAIVIALAMTVCFFVGCTKPEETVEPTATPAAETATPEPATATPEPTPTPEPVDPSTLYTWVYEEFEPGKIDVSIKLKEGITEAEIDLITEIVVPSEIDGKTVAKIPWDFFGCRSRYGARQGFMRATETDADGKATAWDDEAYCKVQKVTFPATIEYFENDMFGFAIGGDLVEFVFEGEENIKEIWGYAFAYTPAQYNYCVSHGGSMILNKKLVHFDVNGQENYVVPDGVEEIAPRLCQKAFVNWDIGIENDFMYLETFTVNDGCKKICKGIFECAEYVEWIYIPASVTEIVDYLCAEDAANRNTLVVKAPAGSYAIEWAKDNNYLYEEVN